MTADQLSGHYIDSYFNEHSRSFITKSLIMLAREHGIEKVRPSAHKSSWYYSEILKSNEGGQVTIENLFQLVPRLYGYDAETNIV